MTPDRFLLCLLAFLVQIGNLIAQRVPVLNQIELPHNYYYRELYLPQLTSGPSSLSWSPDGKYNVYSMSGSLWKQEIGSDLAEQITDGEGYDYQPDWSPDGSQIVFVRYGGDAMELMLLEVATGKVTHLTQNKNVNLEPRWSPDGHSIAFVSTINSHHFLLYKATVQNKELSDVICLTPDRKSTVNRYYYSAYDHAINPVWSRNGKEIYFVSNHEIIHGTGDIVKLSIDAPEKISSIRHEETSWKTRPDVSPDGSRLVYSSYLGGNWHQLWLLPTDGGYPIPLTYGEYDNTSPRWSPDGKNIAFISNREGNTSIWFVNAYDGGQKKLNIRSHKYLKPHLPLTIIIQDENGKPLAARISINDTHEEFYSPSGAWIQADDSRHPEHRRYESHYFHASGTCELMVPSDTIFIEASHGPEYEISKIKIDTRTTTTPVIVTIKRLSLPAEFGEWRSGDLHVHMNYGGHYLNTPEILLKHAECEDLNFVFNLIVNKEQRIPDIKYFSTSPDKVSTDETMILQTQEYHTSFWGHLGLLNLNDHLLLPDYVAYPGTAVASIFPHNKFIAELAHQQNGVVGYVHPFEHSEIFPELSARLTNELPIDAALGLVDYYELLGFSDHKASEEVWYKLLNCGLQIPAGAGSDAMANYASLRGPVGLNRVYVRRNGPLNQQIFLDDLKQGRSFVTNGPLLGINVDGVMAGDTINIGEKGRNLSYAAFLRSAIPVEHFEIVFNGKVVASHRLKDPGKSADVQGHIKVNGPGWLLIRAWSEKAHPDLNDIYPYASTNPIYIQSERKLLRSKSAGEYFLKWLKNIESAVVAFNSYRSEEEKSLILDDIKKARLFYENCVQNPTVD